MRLRKPSSKELASLRTIADYQFGPPAGRLLIPDDVLVAVSPNTLRIRNVVWRGRILATLRAQDGLYSLSIEGAKLLNQGIPEPRLRVYVEGGVAEYIARGRNVFAKHVVRVDPGIRAGDEVLVVDEACRILAVGKARFSGVEIPYFRSGEVVRVRKGVGSSWLGVSK